MPPNSLARKMSVAYRVFIAAKEVDWRCSVRQLADQIGEPQSLVREVINAKGWNGSLTNEDAHEAKQSGPFDVLRQMDLS